MLGYGADLSAYRDAVVSYMAGVNPYEVYSHLNFVYPPAFLILNGWMAALSGTALGVVWQMLLIACAVSAVWWWRNKWLAMILIWWFFPVRFALGMGQASLLLLGMLTLVGYCQSRKYYTWEGILIGLAGGLKLVPLLWLMVAFQEKRYKTVAVGLTVFAGLNLAAILKFGDWELGRSFVEVTLAGMRNESVYYYNQGLPALIYRMGGSGVLVSGVSLVLWGWCWWRMTKIKESSQKLALVAFVAVMTSTVAWQHHFVLALPLILVSLRAVRAKPRLAGWIWWWSAVILLGMNLKQPRMFAISSLIYNHAAWGGLLLLLE